MLHALEGVLEALHEGAGDPHGVVVQGGAPVEGGERQRVRDAPPDAHGEGQHAAHAGGEVGRVVGGPRRVVVDVERLARRRHAPVDAGAHRLRRLERGGQRGGGDAAEVREVEFAAAHLGEHGSVEAEHLEQVGVVLGKPIPCFQAQICRGDNASVFDLPNTKANLVVLKVGRSNDDVPWLDDLVSLE